MERIQLKGRAPTIRDTQRAAMSRFTTISVTDFDDLRERINSRQFVGPATPLSLRQEFSHDAESARYWRMAADIQRYGYCEKRASGTPWVGDVFGH